MDHAIETRLRATLTERRDRLTTAAEAYGEHDDLRRLIGEVDAALERMSLGTYGICESCHDPIEEERLAIDPLCRYCLDHLTPSEQRALEQDLEMAARIQGGLLPRPDAGAHGWEIHRRYQPLGAVSGDYCDLVTAAGDGSEQFALLGDVAGKGVAASILMAQLHATFRTLIDVGLPLETLLERANRIFCESVASSKYATLVCAKLGPSGEAVIANAGHVPPLLVRGAQVSRIRATGLPMGLFCSGSFSVQEVRLHAGDTLFLCTDGLTETRSPAGEEYGLDRLVALLAARHALPPAALADTCLADLASFRAGAPRADDLTLMVVRRTG
jgi:sigma-B regulation protein RsbU (phosphoserine phosphatase)